MLYDFFFILIIGCLGQLALQFVNSLGLCNCIAFLSVSGIRSSHMWFSITHQFGKFLFCYYF